MKKIGLVLIMAIAFWISAPAFIWGGEALWVIVKAEKDVSRGDLNFYLVVYSLNKDFPCGFAGFFHHRQMKIFCRHFGVEDIEKLAGQVFYDSDTVPEEVEYITKVLNMCLSKEKKRKIIDL